jgi:hypothetical protein
LPLLRPREQRRAVLAHLALGEQLLGAAVDVEPAVADELLRERAPEPFRDPRLGGHLDRRDRVGDGRAGGVAALHRREVGDVGALLGAGLDLGLLGVAVEAQRLDDALPVVARGVAARDVGAPRDEATEERQQHHDAGRDAVPP